MAKTDRQTKMSERFLAQMRPDIALTLLLDYLPDVAVFAKDRRGRFVLCNQTCATLLGARRVEDVIGRLDSAFSPRHLCEAYARDDAALMSSGKPIVDKIELVRNSDGSIDWYNTTKVPVLSRRGRIIGIAGVTRDLKKMNSRNARFLEMAPVIETIMNRYGEVLSIRELARKASLSVSQFERRFKRRFRMTPLKYIMQVRLNAACELLTASDLPLTSIALETGFCDQSHFTYQFTRHKGLSPLRYRKKYGREAPLH